MAPPRLWRAMRSITFFSLTTLLTSASLVACGGGGGTGTGSGGGAASTSSSSSSASTGSVSSSSSGMGGMPVDGITGTAKDLYTPKSGDVMLPNTTSFTAIGALVDQG